MRFSKQKINKKNLKSGRGREKPGEIDQRGMPAHEYIRLENLKYIGNSHGKKKVIV